MSLLERHCIRGAGSLLIGQRLPPAVGRQSASSNAARTNTIPSMDTNASRTNASRAYAVARGPVPQQARTRAHKPSGRPSSSASVALPLRRGDRRCAACRVVRRHRVGVVLPRRKPPVDPAILFISGVEPPRDVDRLVRERGRCQRRTARFSVSIGSTNTLRRFGDRGRCHRHHRGPVDPCREPPSTGSRRSKVAICCWWSTSTMLRSVNSPRIAALKSSVSAVDV